jgi:hypothetical protein
MTDLTKYAEQGFRAAEYGQDKSPFLCSAPCDIAWKAGYWLGSTGRSAPRRVTMSRGYTINANDMKLRWLTGNSFERVA